MIDMKMWGVLSIPATVLEAAEPIKLLNYKTTTPTKFKKNILTEDIGGSLMRDLSRLVSIPHSKLDYVFFSVCKGAEPHVDALDPEKFTPTTFVIPVILPTGDSIISAGHSSIIVELGGVYEFNHEKKHSMYLEDTESGCVVVMVALKK